MTKLALAAVLVLFSCGDDRVVGRDGEDVTADRHEELIAQIPHLPHVRSCNGSSLACGARVRTDSSGTVIASVVPSGFGASDLAAAYGIPTTGAGAGISIAVVDAFNYPNAESDLATYRAQFGLPACTKANGCLKIVNKDGASAPLPPNHPSGDDWTIEGALDLQIASAGCPSCKLILVEATSDQDSSLFVSENGAVAAGATVISNSWGGPDDGNSPTYETQYFTHPGVSIFVATGDEGYTGSLPYYPSTSAHVTAVGGTSLVKNTGTARGWSESAWADSGSSCSKTIAKPTYQTTTACSKRAAADVSAVGDPNTGVAVYNAGAGGWIVVGGTSAATPLVAAIYANSGHAGAGPDFAYAHVADFFDVTTGANGTCSGAMCHAGAGWDGPTGLGTPNGAALYNPTACVPACSNKACGDDGCGGVCGTCPTGESCTNIGVCQVSQCTPSCSGKTCGSDGCGGTCGTCANGGSCSAAGTCTASTCAHPTCSTGVAETATCDSCAAEVCAQDSYCCTVAWDSICVGEVGSVCHETCGGGSTSTCAHSECNTGAKEKKGCDSCVTQICNVDSYCCNTRWDSVCVGEVSSVCAESCSE